MHPLVKIAKNSVETFTKTEQMISPSNDLPKEFLNRRSGTFVTIESQGQLRGCIGTYLPIRQNIAEEVIYNAIAAAKEDYRFGPIQEEELPNLSYTVYILDKPELIKNIFQLNPKEYGIIVKSIPMAEDKDEVTFNGRLAYKTGLLLPDLEGIDTPEKQVSIACQKAIIDPKTEKFLIYRFTAEKYQ